MHFGTAAEARRSRHTYRRDVQREAAPGAVTGSASPAHHQCHPGICLVEIRSPWYHVMLQASDVEGQVLVVERIINAAVRTLARLVFRLELRELAKIPKRGPAILVSNHTSNLEAPFYYVYLRPRPTTGLAKAELWDNPIMRMVMQVWRLIPVHRNRMDSRAIRRCLRALDRGAFLGIAPEGTRSKSAVLQRGYPGVALLATARRVPIYPMAQQGASRAWENLRKLRRTPFVVRVGEPFVLRGPEGRRPSLSELRAMTDELMYRIAELLPSELRGPYQDMSRMTSDYIERIPTATD